MHMIDGDAELHDKFMIKITTRFSTQTFTTVSQCYRVACADANWCTVRTMSLPKKTTINTLVRIYVVILFVREVEEQQIVRREFVVVQTLQRRQRRLRPNTHTSPSPLSTMTMSMYT